MLDALSLPSPTWVITRYVLNDPQRVRHTEMTTDASTATHFRRHTVLC